MSEAFSDQRWFNQNGALHTGTQLIRMVQERRGDDRARVESGKLLKSRVGGTYWVDDNDPSFFVRTR